MALSLSINNKLVAASNSESGDSIPLLLSLAEGNYLLNALNLVTVSGYDVCLRLVGIVDMLRKNMQDATA
jgi:hypothetical protein